MSANVLDFDVPRFGGCPAGGCRKTDGYVNLGAAHWFVCDAHRTRWPAGENVFSDWKDETEAEQRIAWSRVVAYRVVRPFTAGSA